MRAGLPGVEPVARLIPLGRTQMERPGRLIHVHQDEQEYPDHMNDREEIPVANGTLANNSLQKNQPSIGRRIEERQVLPPNEVIDQVNDQHPSYTVHPKRPQMARLHRVIHSDEMQDGPASHEVHGDATHTEMIDEATATHGNQRAGCSVGTQTVSTGERHMETPTKITQQVHKHPYHESHAGGSQLYCLDLDGVVHPPVNQPNHGEEASTEMINDTLSRESIWPTASSVEPNSVNAEKRKAPTTDQVKQHMQKQQSDATRAEHVTPPNELTDLKQKNVCTNDENQKEQIEVNVSKQTSGWTQKKNRKGSIASSNAGLQLKRSTRLAKDSVADVENEPLESHPNDLQDFGPDVQVPVDAMDDESIEWEPLQQCPASPDCEVSVAITDTESVESEHDEEYVVSPDESMSESDHPDIDRIVTGLCPSTPSVHKLPQEISDELDDLDLTTASSNIDMSDPEHFARNYCRLLPLEVRRALAKKKYNVFPDRLVHESSNKVSLHDLTDSEGQQQGKRGHKAGGSLCIKVWTLPEGVRVPVSLNTLGLPIGENANMLIYFLGSLARDGILAPLTCISWKNIPKENKDVMWHIVKLKFDVDPTRELSVLRSIRNKWRVWKCHLKRKHYDSHITEEERLADRDPRVPKEQWRVLVAYWNTEKAKARSAASKASRAKSTYINKTGSKSFARIRREESRSGDSLGNPEGSGDDYAPAMGAKRRVGAHRYTAGPSPEDLQERSDPQAARAKRKAGNEVSTPRKKVIVTEESRPKNSQESAVLEAVMAKKRAEDEAVALRKRVIVMEENQKKMQEDLARMTNAVSAMQKMMSTGGLPNQNR